MGFIKSIVKPIKKIAGFAAPIAGAFLGSAIPGIGTALGGSLGGALGGAISGGGVKGILGGALGGYGIGGGGASLGSFLGSSGALGNALGSGILGAAGGALGGGVNGALMGGALGAGGGYVQGSGGLGNAFKNITGAGGATGGGGGLSSSYGLDDYSALEKADNTPNGFLTQAKDFLTGTKTPGMDDYSVLNNADNAAGALSSSNYLTPALSAGIGGYTNNKAENQLLKQQGKAFDTLSPFLNSKFDASNLASDPGYQFQLEQGTKAIDRAASARGNYFSGQALTDAADYSKGLTDTTLNDAYSRYLTDNAQKIGVAGGLTNIYDNIGNVQAGATTNLGNIFTGSLAAATGKQGVNSSGQIVGGQDNLQRLLASLTPQQRAQLGY